MEVYQIQLNAVTLEDCIDLCNKKEVRTIVEDGRIRGFEQKNSTPILWRDKGATNAEIQIFLTKS